ncbi:hypothetical protein J6590_086376 [Homalodisca vitripennis]|nr:hypothetical protein J6590_086376 [Homalodisca vitripennis]
MTCQELREVVVHLAMLPFDPWLNLLTESRSPSSSGFCVTTAGRFGRALRILLRLCRSRLVSDKSPSSPLPRALQGRLRIHQDGKSPKIETILFRKAVVRNSCQL